jgi:hypothetical protein
MNALPEDSYWAAKIVMSFKDEDIRAVVRAGGLTDPQAEQYLIETLIERRNKIGRQYLSEVLSVDHLRLNGSSLEFDHLSSSYGFSEKPLQYTLAWFQFDNDKDERTFINPKVVASGTGFPIPPDLLNGAAPYFGVEIESESKTVSVFMERSAPLRIVGIERSWNGK